MNVSADSSTGDSIISNHPVVTSLLTRGLNNAMPQAPLPSIKSLQQKHNPSFIQQQQQQQMIFQQNQPDPQQFVDGLTMHVTDEIEKQSTEQDYDQLMFKLRLAIDTACQRKTSSM